MQSVFRNTLAAAAVLLSSLTVSAQNAASFLSIAPDARSAAMGGAGVALSPDAFSTIRNAAQLPFADEYFGAGYCYLPWMRDLTPETALHTASVFFKPNSKQAVSASFRYFYQYGSEITDDTGNLLGRLKPKDMAVDVGYSRFVAKGLSVALTARYIRSDLGAGGAKNAFAFDAGIFYRYAFSSSYALSFGFQAANFGNAIDYGAGKRHQPWSLKLGTAADLDFSMHHRLTITAETGYRLQPSAFRAWSGSFGAEYVLYDILSVRGGYRLGDRRAGEFRYGSVGLGLRWKYVAADAAYLLTSESCPLHDTWMISFGFRLLGKR